MAGGSGRQQRPLEHTGEVKSADWATNGWVCLLLSVKCDAGDSYWTSARVALHCTAPYALYM